MVMETDTDRRLSKIKDNKFVSSVVIIAIVVIGIGSFTDAVDSILTFFDKRLTTNLEVEAPTAQNLITNTVGMNDPGNNFSLQASAEHEFSPSMDSPDVSTEGADNEDNSGFISATEHQGLPTIIEAAQEIVTIDAEFDEPAEIAALDISNNVDLVQLALEANPSESLAQVNEQNVIEESQVNYESIDAAIEALTDDDRSGTETLTNNAENVGVSPILSEEVIVSRFEFARAIPSTISRGDTLLQVAKLAADNSYFDLAIKAAELIPSTITQGTAFAYIARSAFSTNQLTVALVAANEIPSSILRGEVLSEMATAPNN
jgi:lysophospholipase L1-like esterase